MGIRFLCDTCDKKLNVKSFLAGKKGICPHCGARARIPHESLIPSSKEQREADADAEAEAIAEDAISFGAVKDEQQEAVAAPAVAPESDSSGEHDIRVDSNRIEEEQRDGDPPPPPPPSPPTIKDPISEAPDAVWYVRPPSGGQYGPAEGEVMGRWITEGRVSADSLVWREGWEDWHLAVDEFPSLDPQGPQRTPASEEEPTPDSTTKESSNNHESNGDNDKEAAKPAARPKSKRRDSSVMGVAIVALLGLLAVILAIIFIILVTRSRDGESEESSEPEQAQLQLLEDSQAMPRLQRKC